MINVEFAEEKFKEYVKQFETQDDKIEIKITHTFGVEKACEYIAKKLNLSDEEINLASLIGLLHDIGRFKQAVEYNDFDDYNTMDHAEFGIKLLFDEGLIKEFIVDRQYDGIIKIAIKNHNKYEIEEGLSDKEILFSKIVRDADKLDNFEVKQYQNLNSLLKCSKEEAESQKVTPRVWEEFLSEKTIISSHRITAIDRWISFIAWIYDFNFDVSLEYILKKDSIKKVINRLDYKDPETKEKMEYARKRVEEYINKRLKI